MRTVKPASAVVALVLLGTLAACGGDADPQARPTDDDPHAHHHDDSGGDEPAGGEFTVGLGGPVSLTGAADDEEFEVTYAVTDVETVTEDDAGNGPAEHDVLVVAHVTVVGFRGDHPVGADNTAYMFCLVDADGTEYHQSSQRVEPSLEGTVSADETATGTVVFDVPESAVEEGLVRLTAKANGGDQTIFWR